jgi:hypothetical protein
VQVLSGVLPLVTARTWEPCSRTSSCRRVMAGGPGMSRAFPRCQSPTAQIRQLLTDRIPQEHEASVYRMKAWTFVTTRGVQAAHHLERFASATYVFPSRNGGPLHAAGWRTTFWHRAVRRAGLSPLRLHDRKHIRVAFLAAAGVDPSEIARRASVAFTYDTTGTSSPRPIATPRPSSTGSAPAGSMDEGRWGQSRSVDKHPTSRTTYPRSS